MIAVYTSIIGSYDSLKKHLPLKGVDYYSFSEKNYTESFLSNSKISRYFKLHPHLFFKEY